MEDNESIQDQLDELHTRMIELNEFARHIPLIGEAFGLIKGMLIDVIEPPMRTRTTTSTTWTDSIR